MPFGASFRSGTDVISDNDADRRRGRSALLYNTRAHAEPGLSRGTERACRGYGGQVNAEVRPMEKRPFPMIVDGTEGTQSHPRVFWLKQPGHQPCGMGPVTSGKPPSHANRARNDKLDDPGEHRCPSQRRGMNSLKVPRISHVHCYKQRYE